MKERAEIEHAAAASADLRAARTSQAASKAAAAAAAAEADRAEAARIATAVAAAVAEKQRQARLPVPAFLVQTVLQQLCLPLQYLPCPCRPLHVNPYLTYRCECGWELNIHLCPKQQGVAGTRDSRPAEEVLDITK